MKKRVLVLLLITAVALPALAIADVRIVTIEWVMPPNSSMDTTDYYMYYSYDTNPPDTQNPISSCSNWEETTPNNYKMVCPSVEIQQYPVYFYIGAVKENGEIILSPPDKIIIPPPTGLKVVNVMN